MIASLSNAPYTDGYVIETAGDRLPSGGWQETFNSDAGINGGKGIGNFGAVIPVSNGRIQLRLTANGFRSSSGGKRHAGARIRTG